MGPRAGTCGTYFPLFFKRLGLWFLAASREGWYGGKLVVPLRFAMFAAALCLIHPGTVTDLIGLAIGAPIYLWQRLRARRVPAGAS